MKVVVAVATPEGAKSCDVDVADGATVADAVAASTFADEPYAALAVYGEVAGPGRLLNDGDRVELLSCLLVDPKTARRNRAASAARSSPPTGSRTHPPHPRPPRRKA